MFLAFKVAKSSISKEADIVLGIWVSKNNYVAFKAFSVLCIYYLSVILTAAVSGG